jgi:hypothetical protein
MITCLKKRINLQTYNQNLAMSFTKSRLNQNQRIMNQSNTNIKRPLIEWIQMNRSILKMVKASRGTKLIKVIFNQIISKKAQNLMIIQTLKVQKTDHFSWAVPRKALARQNSNCSVIFIKKKCRGIVWTISKFFA